jgi:hypothetical protein
LSQRSFGSFVIAQGELDFSEAKIRVIGRQEVEAVGPHAFARVGIQGDGPGKGPGGQGVLAASLRGQSILIGREEGRPGLGREGQADQCCCDGSQKKHGFNRR